MRHSRSFCLDGSGGFRLDSRPIGCTRALLVRNGKVLATLPLPIAGLMADRPADEVNEILHRMSALAREMGVPDCYDPFQTMSFLSLPVIPELRLTDRGVFDVEEQRYW